MEHQNIFWSWFVGLGLTLVSLAACSDAELVETAQDDRQVVVSLSCSGVDSKQVTLSTRASSTEEKMLENLYVYIFSESGQLKGFKKVVYEDSLNQNTDLTTKGSIKVKTTSGKSYIFAVANVENSVYPVALGHSEGQLPVDFDEDKLAEGEETTSFTMSQLLNLPFIRRSATSHYLSGSFLLTGTANNGEPVRIKGDGTIISATTSSVDPDVIKLRKNVAKVKFNIKPKSGDGLTRTFTAEKYDLVNVSMKGPLFGRKYTGENSVYATPLAADSYSNVSSLVFAPGDVDGDASFFEIYLPENVQTAKNSVTAWNEREADNQSSPKTFANAPDYGTYVVLHGIYTEQSSSVNKTAYVDYYIHLGDFSTDLNDYSVDRNYAYTYTITVNGVNNIQVEAQKNGNDQPATEGLVLQFDDTGKVMTLDSHYEYMVMRFYQNEIQTLKNSANPKGYIYQVKTFGNSTDARMVTDTVSGSDHGVDMDWIEFVEGGTYSSTKSERGKAVAYPGKGNSKIKSVNTLLKELYANANTDSYWSGSGTNRYKDFTCFVDENYYSDRNWNEYVNDVPNRTFYIAKSVDVSSDGRSLNASTIYGLTQYPIQTFYDRSQAASVVAYGCETTNDEEGKNFSPTQLSSGDDWNGRSNMLNYVNHDGTTNAYMWTYYTESSSYNTKLQYACLTRNRDLNGDGYISSDEIRWYAPTKNQYMGLVIGKDALSRESRLYNKSSSTLGTNPSESGNTVNSGRMIYWTSTPGVCNFFAEEAGATGDNTSGAWHSTYVRCVRNLKSQNVGYDATPQKYYEGSEQSNGFYYKVDLNYVDETCLNTSGSKAELIDHVETDMANRPAKSFYIAKNRIGGGSVQITDVLEGKYKCRGNCTEDGRTWRVPNQTEWALMYVVNGSTFMTTKTYCRTTFSNTSFRYAWCWTGLIQLLQPSQITADDYNNGYVRCVSVSD